jgi:hypothetical protein
MAGIASKMAGIATYLPHFFLDSGISTRTIFYGTRTTTTTTTLNLLYIEKPPPPLSPSWCMMYSSASCRDLQYFLIDKLSGSFRTLITDAVDDGWVEKGWTGKKGQCTSLLQLNEPHPEHLPIVPYTQLVLFFVPKHPSWIHGVWSIPLVL